MAYPPLSLDSTRRSIPVAAASQRPLGVALLALALGAGLLIFVLRAAPPGETDSADSPGAEEVQEQTPAEEPGEPPADAAVASATGAEAGAEPRREERRQKLLERMWWNRPKHYEPIGLDAPLRARMDARLIAYLTERGDSERQNDAYREFRRALTDGDWQLARQRIENLGTSHVAPLQRQAAMMVDIMEMLDAEQHRRLTEDHAGLLAGPWISNRGLRGGSRRPAPQ